MDDELKFSSNNLNRHFWWEVFVMLFGEPLNSKNCFCFVEENSMMRNRIITNRDAQIWQVFEVCFNCFGIIIISWSNSNCIRQHGGWYWLNPGQLLRLNWLNRSQPWRLILSQSRPTIEAYIMGQSKPAMEADIGSIQASHGGWYWAIRGQQWASHELSICIICWHHWPGPLEAKKLVSQRRFGHTLNTLSPHFWCICQQRVFLCVIGTIHSTLSFMEKSMFHIKK